MEEEKIIEMSLETLQGLEFIRNTVPSMLEMKNTMEANLDKKMEQVHEMHKQLNELAKTMDSIETLRDDLNKLVISGTQLLAAIKRNTEALKELYRDNEELIRRQERLMSMSSNQSFKSKVNTSTSTTAFTSSSGSSNFINLPNLLTKRPTGLRIRNQEISFTYWKFMIPLVIDHAFKELGLTKMMLFANNNPIVINGFKAAPFITGVSQDPHYRYLSKHNFSVRFDGADSVYVVELILVKILKIDPREIVLYFEDK